MPGTGPAEEAADEVAGTAGGGAGTPRVGEYGTMSTLAGEAGAGSAQGSGSGSGSGSLSAGHTTLRQAAKALRTQLTNGGGRERLASGSTHTRRGGGVLLLAAGSTHTRRRGGVLLRLRSAREDAVAKTMAPRSAAHHKQGMLNMSANRMATEILGTPNPAKMATEINKNRSGTRP